jgi:hypothetical protein
LALATQGREQMRNEMRKGQINEYAVVLIQGIYGNGGLRLVRLARASTLDQQQRNKPER